MPVTKLYDLVILWSITEYQINLCIWTTCNSSWAINHLREIVFASDIFNFFPVWFARPVNIEITIMSSFPVFSNFERSALNSS